MRADPIGLAQNATDNPELEALLNPAAAFKHPRDVVSDPDLTLNEKRAILSSWAWACAVESSPGPAHVAAVTFDDVADALRGLDEHGRLIGSGANTRVLPNLKGRLARLCVRLLRLGNCGGRTSHEAPER
jgi:hypothetical protein